MAAEAAAQRVNPLRVKKLYTLAALEIERFRSRMLTTEMTAGSLDPTYATRTMAAQELIGRLYLPTSQKSAH
eukprot:220819-Pyramimonas_sp.AAC.1